MDGRKREKMKKMRSRLGRDDKGKGWTSQTDPED